MGYGETRLKVPTADNKKESRNRRVEIQFIKL
jgi:outer membrane protein OmpA-like peptidoglycan-associated protein